jgi:hypothetical protein
MGAGAHYLVSALPPATAERLGLGAPKAGDGAPAAPQPSIRDLLQPRPKAPERPAPEGYGEKERQDMQRLIDSTAPGREKRQ